MALSVGILLQNLTTIEAFQATTRRTMITSNHNLLSSGIPSHQRVATRQWVSMDEESILPPMNAPEGAEEEEEKKKERTPFYKLPKAACRIYASYVRQLWKETDVAAREKVANEKVRGSIRNMQNILLHAKEYAEFDDATYESQQTLMAACEEMLESLPKREPSKTKKTEDQQINGDLVTTESSEAVAPKQKKGHRSILFGALMGLTVALWVFSGNYIFTGLFCSITILGQLEYYRMIMNTGVYPARRISVIGASSMFLTVS